MPARSESQIIFERYLHEELTLESAADALVDLTLQAKASGGDLAALRLEKPIGWTPSAAELRRADALFAEMERRARGQ